LWIGPDIYRHEEGVGNRFRKGSSWEAWTGPDCVANLVTNSD